MHYCYTFHKYFTWFHVRPLSVVYCNLPFKALLHLPRSSPVCLLSLGKINTYTPEDSIIKKRTKQMDAFTADLCYRLWPYTSLNNAPVNVQNTNISHRFPHQPFLRLIDFHLYVNSIRYRSETEPKRRETLMKRVARKRDEIQSQSKVHFAFRFAVSHKNRCMRSLKSGPAVPELSRGYCKKNITFRCKEKPREKIVFYSAKPRAPSSFQEKANP